MHAAVVELDALADAVGPAAQDDDLAAAGGRDRLVLLVVGRVEVRGERFELRRAGVHDLVRRHHPGGLAHAADFLLAPAGQKPEVFVGKTHALGRAERLGPKRAALRILAREHGLELDQLAQVLEKPDVDPGQAADLLGRHPGRERVPDLQDALRRARAQVVHEGGPVDARDGGIVARVEARPPVLERAQGLVERLLERAPDPHGLAHRFHLRGEPLVVAREFLEIPARHLHDHVVDGGLERGRGLAGDVVRDLVQPVADRELGGDLGDREPGRLRGERGAARHARVHLDHDHVARFAVEGELDVGAAGLHPDACHDLLGRIPHGLVLDVGQRLGRRDRDAVAGVDSHGVEVLDRADDHEVVRVVAHDLELVLLPAEHRLLDQHLVHGAGREPPTGGGRELLAVVDDAAADPAERVGGPDDEREADRLRDPDRLLHRAHRGAVGHLQADLAHGVAEELTVLRQLDRLELGADQLDAVFLEHAGLGELDGEIQAGLAAERRQQRVRALLFDDPGQGLEVQRLDVGPVRKLRVGHDGGRVAVHQDDDEPLLLQGPAGLGAGVVELAGLTDHDRPGADHQDPLDVFALRHGNVPSL